MGMKTKIGHALFVGAIFALCLIPSVGLLWDQSAPIDSAASQTPLPAAIDEKGNTNVEYLSELGSYFETHFAYRAHAVDLNARLRVALTKTSPTDQVIIGNSGWLYYGGTLNDHLGKTELSEHKANNIAHNLSLVQGYTRSTGSDFVFTIAPNKNSLYPENMPYYYPQGDQKNRSLIKQCLANKDIAYVDLFETFSNAHEVLYYQTDSHWTQEGALLATKALSNKANVDSKDKSTGHTIEHIGDIETMLYPTTASPETTEAISLGSWTGEDDDFSVENSYIKTTSSSGSGTLLMFRDSFGDSLIPLMSPLFEQSYYSKLIPYNFTQLESLKPTCVVIERAERHVGLLAEDPPIMPAPRVQIEATIDQEESASIELYRDGGYYVVAGWLHENESTLTDIVLQVEKGDGSVLSVVPFYMSTSPEDSNQSDQGFRAYLPDSAFTDGPFTVTVLRVHKTDNGSYDTAIAVKSVEID